MKKPLSRRTLLRGMGAASLVGVALPALEAMLDHHGTAYAADASPFPKRFGVWYYGCGLTRNDRQLAIDSFFPKTVGSMWEVPPLLEPLTASRDYLTIVGGTHWTIAENTPHHVSRTAPLSGSYNLDNVGKGIAQPEADPLSPSIDRLVADAWTGQAPVGSVEMAVSRVGKYEGMISFKPKQSFPSEFDPANVFRRLFANGVPPGASAGSMPVDAESLADAANKVAARKSVLDVVSADAQDLAGKLGKSDAQRLEAHMAGIRDLERSLDQLLMNGSLPAASNSACALPTAPGATEYDKNKENFEGVHKAHADLLVMALACDLTRVFSMEFTGAQCNTNIWPSGSSKPYHDGSHTDLSEEAMLKMAGFSLKQFGYLVDRLRATPQGASNLLDSCAIYCVNEYLHGASHSMKNGDHPILIAGKANGALRAGQYVRPASTENGSRVGLALLHAVGVMAPSFGAEAGMATEPLPGLLT
ncbi:MAG TPA: DUF1552 domain-containing protein [Polyangiaceae bacterium]|nr:DUF1552 domain-containing protein [Polyangiaceae bacterium]